VETLVAELARRGKLLVGDPFFEGGVPVTVDRKGAGEAAVGDLVLLRLGRGRAKVERVLGKPSAIEAVLEGLLWHRGVRRPSPPVPPEPGDEVDAGRVDLRDLATVTIDPDTAKDFDDAISVRAEGDGLRAWVHIADVSAYVPPGSPLDRDASERAFSTYVPGLVEPMLPEELSNDRCSLRPLEDRRAVTVEIPFDAGLRPGEPRFYRSLIRSNERLTYGQAQAMLAGDLDAAPETADTLRLARRLTVELRRRRFARGALQVQTPEVAFRFADGRVADAWLEGEPHAHMLVEELMILANERVAEFLSGRNRAALYRVHERPDIQAIDLLLAKLADLGVPTPPVPEHLSPQGASALAGEISRVVAEYTEQSGRGKEAFPALVLRALKQARYDPSNLGHSGLASRAYCHFTSPIRRYPDLVVHRVLMRELGQGDDPVPDELDELAAHTSARERAAAQVEYLADEICLAWLLEDRLYERGWDDPWPGEVIGLIGSGLFVRFGEVFEGFLPARRLPGEFFELNPTGTALAGRTTGRRFRLGDAIEVRVESIARNEGKVELALPASASPRSRRGRR